MALDANRLEKRFLAIFSRVTLQLFPDVIKNVTVREVKREDGTMDHEIIKERGPMEIDKETLTPLARALALAVVEEIRAGAEVTTTGASGTWRVT